MTTTVAEGPAAFPAPRNCPFGVPPQYERLSLHRTPQKVALADGSTAWLLTSHEDVRAMLSDLRFSSDLRKPGFPSLIPGQQALAKQVQSMIRLDGPEHAAARRAVISEFSVRRIAVLKPRIQQIVDGFIDTMLLEDHPVDLVESLSLPIPSLVICELLGIPSADHHYFQVRASRLLRHDVTEKVATEALNELVHYLDHLVEIKETTPGDDLLSRQIHQQQERNGTVDRVALTMLARLLLVAGHETTANMISLGVIGLLANPGQLAAIVADPTKTPLAVEELLRYFTIADVVPRVAMEDVEIAGVLIRASEGVIAEGLTANRDQAMFDDPDELDVERGARYHVAFGYGPHQCLGQNLARLELQVVFDTLFRRIPRLRVATGLEEVPFKEIDAIYGVRRLPVTW